MYPYKPIFKALLKRFTLVCEKRINQKRKVRPNPLTSPPPLPLHTLLYHEMP